MNKIKNTILNRQVYVKRHLGGFTLIELLVVVLIIGILSSVALPQYTKAVEKARAAEAVQNLASLGKALSVYVMANGVPGTGNGSVTTNSMDLSELDVTLDLNCNSSTKVCSSKNFEYKWFGSCVSATRKKSSSISYVLNWCQEENQEPELNCDVYDDMGYDVCKGLTGYYINEDNR